MESEKEDIEIQNNVPAQTEKGLSTIEKPNEDVMIVSDGELPTDANEVLPEKIRHMPAKKPDNTELGEPRPVTHFNSDFDESMSGGYASVHDRSADVIRPDNRLVWIVLIVMSVIAILVGVCSSLITAHFMRRGTPPQVIETVNKYQDMSGVIGARERSMVEVSASGGSVRGSGIITKLDSGKIYILTNYHVISTGNLSVRYNTPSEDGWWEATEVGHDEYYDVAVITVEASTAPFEITQLDGSDYFRRNVEYSNGDIVVTMGNAISKGIAAYDGIISRKSELLDFTMNAVSKTVPVIRTTAVVNAGMSGGALFDVEGNLLGIGTYRITSSKADPAAGHADDVEDTGLVVPMSVVYPIYKQILEYGSTNVSGMVMPFRPDTTAIGALALYFNGFGGFTAEFRGGKLTVVSLDAGTPAPGIYVGDVITKLGSTSTTDIKPDISRTVGEFACYRYGSYTGAALTLNLRRGDADVQVTVPDYYKFVS